MSEKEQSENNILYFECSSMRELYECMNIWQAENHKQFISLSIQQDCGKFCCLALINRCDLIQEMQLQLTKYDKDITRFRRKALRHIGVAVNFEDSEIPYKKVLAIQSKLKVCTTPAEVIAVFEEEF